MKKQYSIFAAMVLTCSGLFALNENVVVWDTIYRKADSYEQRVAIMLKIMEFKDREFAPVLQESLDELISHKRDSGTTNERYAKNQLAMLLVQELGNLKIGESAESVFTLYRETEEPSLKGEAAIALGKMRATDYAEQLAADLQSINLMPDPDSFRGQEIIALGLVKSLDAMRSIKGYEAVFLASNGWYSSVSKVKETAKGALLTMVDDPTDSIMTVVTGNPDLEIKSLALETVLASKAPNDRKATVASKALEIGVTRATADVASGKAVIRLRVAAMNALIGLQDHTDANVPLYVSVVRMDKKNDATLEETLKAYMALGVNGTDEAARFLAARLGEYNEMERSDGNTVRDKSLIRQIISSMKTSKNKLVKNALSEGQFIDYDGNILRAIEDALASIPD